MFKPPRCPNQHCTQHSKPEGRFFIRYGYHKAKCRTHPVPRFRCRHCGLYFSRQTFRADYRDHRPDINAQVFNCLAMGMGLRQTARKIPMARSALEYKFRKLARHFRGLNRNLRGSLGNAANLQFDEFETFEGCRNTRPLTVPMLIERDSRFVIWAESATIRPRGRMTPKRLARIRKHEAKYGPRKDLSRASILRTFAKGAELLEDGASLLIETDEKKTYPKLIEEGFPGMGIMHSQTSSKLSRNIANPLFPINNAEAMVRDLTGRLRRQSWLASKKGKFLDEALQLWMAYRNYVRRRFNYLKESAAQFLGFVPRRLTARELITWRQDWGRRSIHPLSRGGQMVSGRG